MNRLGITKGQCDLELFDEGAFEMKIKGAGSVSSHLVTACRNGHPTLSGELIANAKLYTDAHNTAQECDLLPSELLNMVRGLTNISGILKIMGKIEEDLFRSTSDTGSHPNAMIVWNSLRTELGLPRLTKDDLKFYDGKSYVMPKGSRLISQIVK